MFNPLRFFFRERFEVFYCSCIFRKVKLVSYAKTVIVREVEVEIQEVVLALGLSVPPD